MAAKTPAERKADERARKRESGLDEVRGLWLTKDERAKVAALGGAEWIARVIRSRIRKLDIPPSGN